MSGRASAAGAPTGALAGRVCVVTGATRGIGRATALELADGTDTPAAFGAACRDLWTSARDALGTPADHTAIVRWLEMRAGTTLASPEGR